jgi:hypothetical protein
MLNAAEAALGGWGKTLREAMREPVRTCVSTSLFRACSNMDGRRAMGSNREKP